MKVRANKIENDDTTFSWIFGRGLSSYKKEKSAIEQMIRSRLLSFKFNCFFALQDHIDWKRRLGYKNQKDLLDNDIKEVILGTSGVYDVTDFDSVVEDRAYSCQCSVVTKYSDIINFSFSKTL